MAAAVLMAIIFFAGIMSSITLSLSNFKVDFTEWKRHSQASAAQNIFKNTEKPINIILYASNDLDANYPELGLHRQNLIRLLEKIQSYSEGKITYSLKNPEPYTPAEYEAQDLGIRPFPDLENTHNLYFGASFSGGEGKKFVIPYFSVQRQNYLEYDISRILAKLNGAALPPIGIVSFGGDISDWQLIKKIKQDYPLVFIDSKMPIIPQNINTMLVFNPQQVNTNFIYALDQYIMRGGNLILLIDPYAEAVAQKYPYTKQNRNLLLPLLQKWGLKMDENTIVADTNLSRPSYQTALSEPENPTYLNLSAQNMQLLPEMGKPWPRLTLHSGGALKIEHPQSNVTYTPLLFTTDQAQTLDADIVKHSSVQDMYNALSEAKSRHNLAYWLEGRFDSAFEQSLVAGTPLAQEFPPFLAQSIKPARVLVIADSDFAADNTWNLTGYQKKATVFDQIPSAANADFILSMIDLMSGNQNLADLKIKYLINDEKNIAEQIYAQIFARQEPTYRDIEKQLKDLQKDLNAFQKKLNQKETAMSLLKIQEWDSFNRRQQQLTERLKALNYTIGQESTRQMNRIILLYTLIFPFIMLLSLFIIVNICKHARKQKNLRIINE